MADVTPESFRQNLTPETVKKYYDELRSPPSGADPSEAEAASATKLIPTRWTDQDFNVAFGYVGKVAKASTLEEFEHFLRTGECLVPVKMTPAEMEVMMGGGPIATWVGAVGAAASIVGAAAASCSNS
jgi:hypothetical protein